MMCKKAYVREHGKQRRGCGRENEVEERGEEIEISRDVRIC